MGSVRKLGGLLLVCIVGCSSGADPATPKVRMDVGTADSGHEELDAADEPRASELVVTPSPATLRVGTTLRLDAKVVDESGETLTTSVDWMSSDADVVEVSAGGVLIGHEIGAATVVATWGDLTTSVDVSVTGAPVATIDVTPANRVMNVGDTVQLTVNLTDEFGAPIEDPRPAEYESSDEEVVTVSDGLVTAISQGNATVTTVVEGVSAESTFNVLPAVAVDRVEVSPVSTRLGLGDELQFSAAAFVGGSQEPSVAFSWSSSNPAVLTVDGTGKATGVGVGTAEVVASAGQIEGRAMASVDLSFSAVAAGDRFSCAVAEGSVYCWGLNDQGQLGHSAGPNPARVAVAAVRDVVAGAQHACALGLNGVATCWGGGDATPAAISGHVFTALFAGADLSCGVEGGSLLCWQPGTAPAVTGSYDAFATSGSHTCATSASGATCWGSNSNGQLGINSSGGTFSSPQPVTGGYDFVELTVGASHSCGTTQAGASACWGANALGQVGDGTTTDRVTPILLGGGVSVTRLVAGDNYTCGLAADGAAMCWGQNSAGQLGDGTTTARVDPTPASGGLKFQALSAGASHVCAASVSGDLYCWGAGLSGELGLPGASLVPRQVPWAEFAP